MVTAANKAAGVLKYMSEPPSLDSFRESHERLEFITEIESLTMFFKEDC
jgi:hypothetical protein